LDIVLNLALPFFGLILLGYVAARFIEVGDDGLGWLNALVWYFALPALIFQTVAEAPFEQLLNVPFIIGTSLTTLGIFLATAALSLFVFRSDLTSAGLRGSAASYGNVGYMGLGLSVAALGPEAAVPAILVFCADNAIQFVLVPLFAALGDNRGERAALALTLQIAKSILLHPFVLATLAGGVVAWQGVAIPVPAERFLSFLTNAAAPCALFALGVTLSRRKLDRIGVQFPIIVFSKLFLHPLLVLAVLSAIGGIEPTWIVVAILMASLPTATNVFILATQYESYVTGASNIVLVTSLISAVTLSALLLRIDRDLVPTNFGSFFNML